jgi:hypothetical protein
MLVLGASGTLVLQRALARRAAREAEARAAAGMATVGSSEALDA